MRIMNKAVWPHQTTVPFRGNDHSDEMYMWCDLKIKDWYLNGNTFCFKHETDFLMFCLRWGA
jgi:hypothetical protein